MSNKKADKESKELKNGFPVLEGKDPKVLILGIFPGKESLKRRDDEKQKNNKSEDSLNQFYYSDSSNRFWSVLEKILNISLFSVDADERKKRLMKFPIALWDIYGSATRQGSSDKNIDKDNSVFNNVFEWLEKRSSVKKVVYNGGLSKNSTSEIIDEFEESFCEKKSAAEERGVRFIRLPSTSKTNRAYDVAKLKTKWEDIIGTL